MADVTTKYAIPYAEGIDAPDIAITQDSAERIDEVMVGYAEGTLAAIPAAGIEGRLYRCTDGDNINRVFMDTGVAWIELNPNHEPLLQGGYLINGANAGANAVFSIGGPLGFSMPKPGRVRVNVLALINEEGATGPTAYTVTPQCQIDAGVWDTAQEGVAGGSVDGAKTDNSFESWNWVKTGLSAGVHTCQFRLAVSNSPVLVVVRGKGHVQVDMM
jgi:hypothetical protein